MRAAKGFVILLLAGIPFLSAAVLHAGRETGDAGDFVTHFVNLALDDRAAREKAFTAIAEQWQEGFVPMALEIMYLTRNRNTVQRMADLLESRTGQEHGFDFNAWYEWLWSRERTEYPYYADFKGELYRLIDPKFGGYFNSQRTAGIRLDEVRWGGVRQDGIPPLRDPGMIPADAADYLDDDNIVFGLVINGDARAYPKRILAWHELFTDQVGGVPVTGVYCTLCGTMIPFRSIHDGTHHRLGTSGFLYRSNKLMYDEETQSLWSTLRGVPVVGPLADRGIELERMSVVTTTWGEWKRRHPDTTVLSPDTGYVRDYSEGAAYRAYFATDELMFNVPRLDSRLANKDEILGLLLAPPPEPPLAISVAFLSGNPIYYDRAGGLRFVVLTDRSSAARVYEAEEVTFTGWDRDASLTDSGDVAWSLTESALTSADGRILERLPAHRAFWFGWYAAYPDTRLVR